MSWPFPEHIRPLMRSALWYRAHNPDDSWEDIAQRLIAQRHDARDVEIALPEARRSLFFAQQLQAAAPTDTFGAVWERCAEDCFRFGYGREPQGQELAWWRTRPGRSLGVMYEITSPNVPNWRYTPTLNADWDAPLGTTAELIRQWFVTGLASPPPPNSIQEAMTQGAPLNVQLIGGALVPRLDPTLTMGQR